jgi:hypothetical protein
VSGHCSPSDAQGPAWLYVPPYSVSILPSIHIITPWLSLDLFAAALPLGPKTQFARFSQPFGHFGAFLPSRLFRGTAVPSSTETVSTVGKWFQYSISNLSDPWKHSNFTRTYLQLCCAGGGRTLTMPILTVQLSVLGTLVSSEYVGIWSHFWLLCKPL